MMRMIGAAFACALVVGASAPADAAQVQVSGDGCEVIRILPDGRETRSRQPSGTSVSGKSSGSSSTVSVRSGGAYASSSAGASSSSGSRSSSRAVSSTTDSEGRTITVTREGNRCTIVIDER